MEAWPVPSPPGVEPHLEARQPGKDKQRVPGCVRSPKPLVGVYRTANFCVADPARSAILLVWRVKSDASEPSGIGEAAHLPDSSQARWLIRT